MNRFFKLPVSDQVAISCAVVGVGLTAYFGGYQVAANEASIRIQNLEDVVAARDRDIEQLAESNDVPDGTRGAPTEEASVATEQVPTEDSAVSSGASETSKDLDSSPTSSPSTDGLIASGQGVVLHDRRDGFDLDQQIVAQSQASGVDVVLYNESLQSSVGPIEPIAARAMPTFADCDGVVGDLDQSFYVYDIGDHDYYCTRTDKGSIAALHVDDLRKTAKGARVDLSYVLYGG